MSRYTLRSFCGIKQIEMFEHRAPNKLKVILDHPRHFQAGQTGPWGEPEIHADRFEIYDSLRFKIFEGNINETLNFVKKLK